MKKIFVILFTLISIAGFSQVKQTYPQYGGKWKRLQIDSALKIPMLIVGVKDGNAGLDTAQIYYNPTDSTVYVWTGTQWKGMGGGSSLTYPYTTNKYLNGYGNFPALNTDSITEGAVNKFFANPMTTEGDMIFRNATVPARLGIGTANQLLRTNAGATAPEWFTPSYITTRDRFGKSGEDESDAASRSFNSSETGDFSLLVRQFDVFANNANGYAQRFGLNHGATTAKIILTNNNNTSSEAGFTSIYSSVTDTLAEFTVFASEAIPTFSKGSANYGSYIRWTNRNILISPNNVGGTLKIANIVNSSDFATYLPLGRNATDSNVVQMTAWPDASATNELQTLANTSDATSHTETLSNGGGSFQLVEGSGITLTTTGTGLDAIITIASTGGAGTVTDFIFTDANGFDGTVTTSTTTPTLSLITTAADDQLMYSNSGAIAGTTKMTHNGTTTAFTGGSAGVYALSVLSITGNGLDAGSWNDLAGNFWNRFDNTTGIFDVAAFSTESNQTPDVGFGSQIALKLESSTTVGRIASHIKWKWTTAVDVDRVSQVEITTVDNEIEATAFTLKGSGQPQFNKLGDGTFTGTATKWLAVDVDGNIIEEDAPGGGGITQEQSEDFTGAMFATDNGDIDFTYNDATPDIAAAVKGDAITFAKLQNIATATFIGRNTAATGDPEELSIATAKTMLNLTGTNSGDQTTIVGITGTKAQFNTAVTDGDFLFVGDAVTPTNLNDVGDATAGGIVDAGNFEQNWRFNTLGGKTGFLFSSSSTAAAGNSQILLQAQLTGANATASQSTIALGGDNSHSGTGAINIGVAGNAANGVDNYAFYAEATDPGNTMNVGYYADVSGSTTNYGIWIDNGITRFDGELNINGSAGTSGQVLTSAGAGATPTWETPTGGGGVNAGAALKATYYPSAGSTVDDWAGVEFGNTNLNTKITQQATTEAGLEIKAIASSAEDLFRISSSAGTGNFLVVDENGKATFGGTAHFTGSVTETASIDRVGIGVAAGTPRMVFEDNGQVVWEIDNDMGTFRWFTPGVIRMTLDGSNGNMDVATGKFSVGGSSSSAMVNVVSSAANVVLIRSKLHASQSANAFEINTSGGSNGDVFNISVAGYVTAAAPTYASGGFDAVVRNQTSGRWELTTIPGIDEGPANLITNTTDVGNVGTGVDDLITYSIEAGKLAADGDYLEFTMTFDFAANANNKQIVVVYGATTIYASGAGAQNDGSMEIKGTIIRTGAATQRITFSQINNGTIFTDYADYITATETLSGAVVLKATGEATSNNDIIQKILIVKYFPVN